MSDSESEICELARAAKAIKKMDWALLDSFEETLPVWINNNRYMLCVKVPDDECLCDEETHIIMIRRRHHIISLFDAFDGWTPFLTKIADDPSITKLDIMSYMATGAHDQLAAVYDKLILMIQIFHNDY